METYEKSAPMARQIPAYRFLKKDPTVGSHGNR